MKRWRGWGEKTIDQAKTINFRMIMSYLVAEITLLLFPCGGLCMCVCVCLAALRSNRAQCGLCDPVIEMKNVNGLLFLLLGERECGFGYTRFL